MKKRSLDPTTRIEAMMPLKSENIPDIPRFDEVKTKTPRFSRSLSPENRLKSMIDASSSDCKNAKQPENK